jgi:hypothetical protein
MPERGSAGLGSGGRTFKSSLPDHRHAEQVAVHPRLDDAEDRGHRVANPPAAHTSV